MMRMMRAKPDITTETNDSGLADHAVEPLAAQLRFLTRKNHPEVKIGR